MAEHDIEDAVKIYLEWMDGAWAVDPVTVDGASLDSPRDGGASCDYNHETEAEERECEELLEAADDCGYPTAQELIPLIAELMTGREIAKAIKELTDMLGDRVREPG